MAVHTHSPQGTSGAAGTAVKTRGAILREPGTRSGWLVEDILIDPPKAGEVLIKLAASGMCHSDDHVNTGDIPLDWGPIIGGHEGAGVIQEVGPGVERLKPGDHVITTFLPSCGHCRFCVTGESNLCDTSAGVLAGTAPDGTHRVHLTDGTPVGPFSYLGTFSPYLCAPALSIIKIDEDIPLKTAALIGCGVPTGWGSAVYAADTQIGDTVVVIGTGGVGMNAVQGARHAGAEQIVAVDPVEWKQLEARVAQQVGDGPRAERALLRVGVQASSTRRHADISGYQCRKIRSTRDGRRTIHLAQRRGARAGHHGHEACRGACISGAP